MDDSLVIYRLLHLFFTPVTCDEILGCLVHSITYIPFPQRSFLFRVWTVLNMESITAQRCPKKYGHFLA